MNKEKDAGEWASSATSPSMGAYRQSRTTLHAYNEDDAPPTESLLDHKVNTRVTGRDVGVLPTTQTVVQSGPERSFASHVQQASQYDTTFPVTRTWMVFG
jgi:hypothetical protein